MLNLLQFLLVTIRQVRIPIKEMNVMLFDSNSFNTNEKQTIFTNTTFQQIFLEYF